MNMVWKWVGSRLNRDITRKEERNMICQTIKSGIECGFMTKKGCGFNGGNCLTIIDKCEGCGKVIEWTTGKYCRMYPDPIGKWRTGKCLTATHIKVEVKEETQKVNPLKASKRASKK
jgi:hypothetical protein